VSDVMTNNVPTPQLSLDDMLAGVDAALAVPQPIGGLYGQVVYLHHDTRELSFGQTRCSVDHPFIAGTKIYDAARRALGEII
jgi:hypothetical protein